MLKRQNYARLKEEQINDLLIDVLKQLVQMTDKYQAYLENPSDKRKKEMLQMEHFVNQSEARINDHILELLSLQPLAKDRIQTFFGMSRIAGLLERVGDQLMNLLTISEGKHVSHLKPAIEPFFHYEREMMDWLIEGMTKQDPKPLEHVILHDQYVNRLNKGTYQSLVHSVQEKESITENNLKIIIISRFLERLGDYLVTIANIYLDFLNEKDRE